MKRTRLKPGPKPSQAQGPVAPKAPVLEPGEKRKRTERVGKVLLLPTNTPPHPKALDPRPGEGEAVYRCFLLWAMMDPKARSTPGVSSTSLVARICGIPPGALHQRIKRDGWKERAAGDNIPVAAYTVYRHVFWDRFQATEVEQISALTSLVIDYNAKPDAGLKHVDIKASTQWGVEQVYQESGVKRLVQLVTLIESAALKGFAAKVRADDTYMPSSQEIRLALEMRNILTQQSAVNAGVQRLLDGDLNADRMIGLARSERVEAALRAKKPIEPALLADAKELVVALQALCDNLEESNAFGVPGPKNVQ